MNNATPRPVIAFQQLGVASRTPFGTHDDLEFGTKLCRNLDEATELLGLALVGLGVDRQTAVQWITRGAQDWLHIGQSTWTDFLNYGAAFGIFNSLHHHATFGEHDTTAWFSSIRKYRLTNTPQWRVPSQAHAIPILDDAWFIEHLNTLPQQR